MLYAIEQAPPRNHPLLLLSGVGTNAIGYDLAPGVNYLVLRFTALLFKFLEKRFGFLWSFMICKCSMVVMTLM